MDSNLVAQAKEQIKALQHTLRLLVVDEGYDDFGLDLDFVYEELDALTKAVGEKRTPSFPVAESVNRS